MTPALPALDALLKKVEALDRAATPGPWTFSFVTNDGEGPDCPWDHGVWFVEVESPDDEPAPTEVDPVAIVGSYEWATAEIGEDNAALVSTYRTAAPRFAAMLRVAVGALTMTQRDVLSVAQYPALAIGIESITRHALARIEAMAKGES